MRAAHKVRWEGSAKSVFVVRDGFLLTVPLKELKKYEKYEGLQTDVGGERGDDLEAAQYSAPTVYNQYMLGITLILWRKTLVLWSVSILWRDSFTTVGDNISTFGR